MAKDHDAAIKHILTIVRKVPKSVPAGRRVKIIHLAWKRGLADEDFPGEAEELDRADVEFLERIWPNHSILPYPEKPK